MTQKPKKSIFNQWFRNYLTVSTIHGLGHLIRDGRHGVERWLWVGFLVAFIYPSYLLVGVAWAHFSLNPSVVSIERDSRSWPAQLPAMTLCQTQVQMPIDTDDYADAGGGDDVGDADSVNDTLSANSSWTPPQNDTSEAEEEVEDRRVFIPDGIKEMFKDRLGKAYNPTDMEHFLNFVLLGNFSSYAQLARYENSVYSRVFTPDLFIGWATEIAEVMELQQNEMASVVFTEFGLCTMFNSEIGHYNTREYWSNNTMALVEPKKSEMMPPKTTKIFHTERMMAFKIFFHSANDYIDLESKHSEYGIDIFTQLEVYMENIWTSYEVGKLGVKQRHCLFTNESTLAHSPVYAYRLCKMECRILKCLQLCGCTPYYYRKIADEKVCNITGLICLSRHFELLTHLRVNNESICKCIQNCDFTDTRLNQISIEPWLMKSSIEATFFNLQTIKYKRTLIYTQIDFLVQIGGIAGLCFGMGFLSIVEFCYHLTMRLLWFLVLKDK